MSLVLERRVTARLYEVFSETPQARARIPGRSHRPTAQHEGNTRLCARRLPARPAYALSEDLFKQREQIYRSATRVSLLTGIVTGTTLALAYLIVAIRGAAGSIDPGGVVLVIGAFTSVSGTLGQISSTFVAVDQHTTFLDDYFSFLAIEPLVRAPAEPETLPAGPRRRHRIR